MDGTVSLWKNTQEKDIVYHFVYLAAFSEQLIKLQYS